MSFSPTIAASEKISCKGLTPILDDYGKPISCDHKLGYPAACQAMGFSGRPTPPCCSYKDNFYCSGKPGTVKSK